jgi:hypothetical protein
MTRFIVAENIKIISCLYSPSDGDDTAQNMCLDACLMQTIDGGNNMASHLLLAIRV